MLLCLDVGNSQMFCGVYDDDELVLQFRRTSSARSSSDELGVFLRGALRENGLHRRRSVASPSARWCRTCCIRCARAAQKYFDMDPLIMRPGSKPG